MPTSDSSRLEQPCPGLLFALVGLLILQWGCETKRAAEEPLAVAREISEERHVLPREALAKAKKLWISSKENPHTSSWQSRLRLLYADILIEQNSPLRGKPLTEVLELLAFQPNDPEISVRLLAAAGYVELKRSGGNYTLSRELTEQALTRERAKSFNDSCWRAEVLLHYSQVLIYLNDRNARVSLAEAGQEALNCPDKYWAAVVPFTSGNYYLSSSRYRQAQLSFENALALAQSHHFIGLISMTRTNLALAYVDMGDFQKALDLLGRSKGSNEIDAALILSISAFVHNIRGENLSAKSDYLEAIAILKPSKPEVYYAYLEDLAAVLIEMNQLDDADRYNREVIQDANPNGPISWIVSEAKLNAASIARLKGNLEAAHRQLISLQKTLNQENDAQVLWRLHAEMAQTLADMKRYKEADREFRNSVETASNAREQMDSDQDRMTFSIYVERLVSRYIDFLVDQKASAETSLKVAETFRAQRLAERLHYEKTPPQEKLKAIASARDAIILSYWITKHNAYLWATNARQTKIFVLRDLQNLDRDIQNHNLDIADQRDLLQTPNSSTDLYRKLIAPAESLIPAGSKVIIVPSGPLTTLDLETLVPPARPPQYWLKTVTMTVAPSLSLASDRTIPQNRFLLVGDTIPKGQAVLPGSVSEINDIQQLFPNTNKLQLTGTNATPQHFLDSRPGEFSLLHISSHAFANKVSPLDSYIMLTPDATHPDGYLYAHDLMNLTMNEDLVTLSACEGAGGKSLPGEGQVGLTWAILSAGAKNVLASSFRVSDHATASFMRDFYVKLSAGEKPSQALHDTKLALVSKSTVPYFWAAFQLYTR